MVSRLWESVPGDPVARVEVIAPEDMPQPYRRLLVHTSDMTSTLTDYYGEPIALTVLDRVVRSGWLARRSLLEVTRTGQPIEFGVIRIHLDILDEPVRSQVLEGHVPLGGLLNDHAIGYRSCPGGFLRVHSSGAIQRAFGLDRPARLYGRCNCLSDLAGRTIAEVVEILPP
jgi:hypothetical protein